MMEVTAAQHLTSLHFIPDVLAISASAKLETDAVDRSWKQIAFIFIIVNLSAAFSFSRSRSITSFLIVRSNSHPAAFL